MTMDLYRDHVVPLFEPILGAAAGELRGFEALVHWRNTDEGPLPPSLDTREETGLIEVIGRRLIRESCNEAARWMALTRAVVPVSVNIALMELSAPDFCDYVERCLARSRLPAAGLVLELSANGLVANDAKAHSTLHRLRSAGVRVRIDDFGAGHSSLADLRELPVSGIKLSRSWFTRLDQSAEQRDIVRAIVALAHDLAMDVVAEGIETMSQFQRVREFGCDFAQGFGVSRPLNTEQAMQYARRHLGLLT